MAEFFASSTHPASGRSAMIADEGDSVWIYLTEPAGTKIAADCWLFNRIPATAGVELEARWPDYRARHKPPPAPAEVITPEACQATPLRDDEVRFVWSADGHSVAAWANGRLAGFIAGAERRGYSSNLLAECPWGRPLDPALHAQLFGEGDRK
jgi:hypothetical protein